MKAYKGFASDMTCRGFRYEEGKSYKTDNAKCCETGFHACENPIECFGYYAPGQSVYREVELGGLIDRSAEDTKVAATKIKIGARLDIPMLCKATFEYVRAKCTNEHNAEPGKPATAGDFGAATAGSFGAATAGDRGAATAGDRGAATAGDRGAATAGSFGAATAGSFGAATAGSFGAATAGDRGAATAGSFGAATAGDSGAATAGSFGAATAGDSGAATAGDSGAATAGSFGAATAGSFGAATAGYRGAATSRGAVSVGEYGVGTVRATTPKIKGGIGAMLTIAREYEYSYDIVAWKSFVVDGETYKPDTWYTLDDSGNVVEVKEGGDE